MNQSILNFAKFYKGISSYGPTRFQNPNYRDSYDFPFTADDFYSDLYVEVPIEKKIKDEANNPQLGKLIAVCGPAGSGKSTASLKVIKELAKDDRTLVHFIDMRTEKSLKNYDDADDEISEKDIRDLILNKFRKKFPVEITPSSKISKRDELIYFLITPEVENKKFTEDQIFDRFEPEVEQIAFLYRKIGMPSKISFRDWYINNLNIKEIVEIQSKVSQKIDIPHYVSYIKYSNAYNKVVIWLDNIDAFSNIQQVQISTFLHNVQKSVLNSCHIVISVREENIYRIGDFSDTFNEPFTSKVTFENPDNGQEITHYGAINVPVIEPEKLIELITKKIKFSQLKYNEYITKYRLLDNDEHEEYAIKFSPKYILSEQEVNSVISISTKIVESFHLEKVLFLSNNSIRDYLRIHSDFLTHLLSDGDNYVNNFFKINDDSKWYISTQFLSWIHTINEPFKLETFNVIDEAGRFKNKNSQAEIGCFLPHLVLTRIWNECIKLNGKPSPYNNPYLKDIINNLVSDFNYDRKVVLGVIFDLYQKVGGYGNFITFREKKKVAKPEELDYINTTVRITYRGKVAIGSIINSFGYLRECSERTDNKKKIKDIEELVINNIKSMAEIHLESIKRIRDNTYSGSADWFSIYMMNYGIPLEAPFVRNHSVGIKLPNIKFNRALYLQTVFVSISNYFRLDKKRQKEVTDISNLFERYLNELISNKNKIETFKFD